jgi:FAD/FMN-containing dehydrogenase
VQYARIEGLKVMVLGTGSSFADNFRLASANVIAIMTYRLSGLQQISPFVTRILSGTLLARLFTGDILTERKTLGGLIAGCQPGRDAAAGVVVSRLLAVEMINAEAKVVRLAASNTAHSGDPGLANALFGSQGRAGIITAVEVTRSLPWNLQADSGADGFVPSVASHDAAVKRTDVIRLLDPDGLFAW